MTARVLGASSVAVFKVEDNGRIIRGVAVPFNEGAIVTGPDGSLVEEVMDEESIEHIADNLPLLVGHDRTRPPAGIVRTAGVSPRGVVIEAELVGSDDELEGWRRRFRQGLSSGLSVGFTQNRKRAVYEKPQRRGGLPVMRPRGLVVHEISLVQWPAYLAAGVVSVSVRTAEADEAQERRDQAHREGERFLNEVRMWQAERDARRGNG